MFLVLLILFKVSNESSAQRLGMKPGDQILSVNGIDFSNITLQEVRMFTRIVL